MAAEAKIRLHTGISQTSSTPTLLSICSSGSRNRSMPVSRPLTVLFYRSSRFSTIDNGRINGLRTLCYSKPF